MIAALPRSVLWLAALVGLAACGPGPVTAEPPLAGMPVSGLTDLEGREVQPLKDSGLSAAVFFFTRTDCPVSNRYAPEVNRLHAAFKGRDVGLWLVYVDREEPAEAIRAHMAEFGYTMDALRDNDHTLVKWTGAAVTPEAAIVVPPGELVYCGRIDDRYADFGRYRQTATRHEVEEVLQAVLEGRPSPYRSAKAVGCFIPDLR